MRSFDAVTGFKDDEAMLFEARLQGLVRRVDPNALELQLRRVIALAGERELTQLAPGIDVAHLLDLGMSDAVHEFRASVQDSEEKSDEQIRAALTSLRPAIASVVQGNLGRLFRFLTVTGVGIIPEARPAAMALGALDTFVLDRIVGKPGPAAILGDQYRSTYRPRSEGDRLVAG